MSDQHADLATHHIEGYAAAAIARGIPAGFRVDLVSHIDGNLWMGGCIGGVRLPDSFDFVLSLYPWERYELGPATVRYEARLYDHSEIPDLEDLDALAEIVCRETARGKTLVHCQAGLNRSGLICALALIRQGRTPAEAIGLLREKRCPLVLCNETFERHLLDLAVAEPKAA